MPDGRTALIDAERELPSDPDERRREQQRRRQRRRYRRVAKGAVYTQGDIPNEIAARLIDRGLKKNNGSTDPQEWFEALLKAAHSE